MKSTRSSKRKRANASNAKPAKQRIEALLIQEQLRTEEIAEELGISLAETKVMLRKIQQAYKNTGIALASDAAGWRFQARAQYRRRRQIRPAAANHSDNQSDDQSVDQLTQPETANPAEQEFREFLDDLNEKIAMISHHNANNAADERIRAKMLSEIEGFLHDEMRKEL